MFTKGVAIVALTKNGVETALRIQEVLDNADLNCSVYAPKKYSCKNVISFDKQFFDFIEDIFKKVDAIAAVMATGIIVRTIAPLLGSKLTDPAVLGVDISGKFVISLVSGHYGGANELTQIIAKGINAIPVITTATDVLEKQSVDGLARKFHCQIQNPDSLAAVNSAIVNDDRVVFVLIDNVKIPKTAFGTYDVKKVENYEEAIEVVKKYDAGIIITTNPLTITELTKPFTILIIKNIVVGLGARKDASTKSIIEAVKSALEKTNIPLTRVNRFATVDIKRNSRPMIEAVNKLGASLDFLSVDVLRSVKNKELSPDSKVVRNKIGVGGVCERAAIVVAGKNSKLIMKKTKLNGVTVAIAKAE